MDYFVSFQVTLNIVNQPWQERFFQINLELLITRYRP